MEEIIKNIRQKEIKKKDSSLSDLYKEITKNKTTDYSIQSIDILKGSISFLKQGKLLEVLTNETILINDIRKNVCPFFFAKPIIHIDCSKVVYSEEYYNEEEDEWEEADENQEPIFRLRIKLFFLISESISYSRNFNNDAIELESNLMDLYYNKNVNIGDLKDCNLISGKIVNKFLEQFYEKKRIDIDFFDDNLVHQGTVHTFVFFDGKRYIDDEIKEIKLPYGKCIYLRNSLANKDKSIDVETTINIDELDSLLNNQNVDNEKFCREIYSPLKSDLFILDKNERKREDVYLNNFLATKLNNKGELSNEISDISINFKEEKIEYNRLLSLPDEKKHYDCCGALMPYNHGNLVGFYRAYQSKDNKFNDDLFNLIYLRSLRNDKANRILFLTDYQYESSKKFYISIFGKDSFKLLDSYVNNNSGNTINVVSINPIERICKELELDIESEIRKSRWDFNQKVSKFSVGNGESMLFQWLKNSEDVVKKKKSVIKSIKEKKINSNYFQQPLKNYATF